MTTLIERAKARAILREHLGCSHEAARALVPDDEIDKPSHAMLAAMAMQALARSVWDSHMNLAKYAHQIADAMIEVRNQRENEREKAP
jgi:hypothetical protein